MSVSNSCISSNTQWKPQNEELLLVTATYKQKAADKKKLKLYYNIADI